MTNIDTVASFIKKGYSYCDDCLSEVLDIKPRQQINKICRQFEKEGSVSRSKSKCGKCSAVKLVTIK